MPGTRFSSDNADARSGANDLREEPVSELLNRLSKQTQTLVRQELELAKVELSEKGKRAGLGAGMFGGAGLLGLFALGALTACFILALATAVAGWLAALIVAVVYAGIAGALALEGRTKVKEATPPIPEQTKESVRRDVEWAKERAKAARS
jgi:uncharacterized membrane protein YqjE